MGDTVDVRGGGDDGRGGGVIARGVAWFDVVGDAPGEEFRGDPDRSMGDDACTWRRPRGLTAGGAVSTSCSRHCRKLGPGTTGSGSWMALAGDVAMGAGRRDVEDSAWASVEDSAVSWARLVRGRLSLRSGGAAGSDGDAVTDLRFRREVDCCALECCAASSNSFALSKAFHARSSS